MQLVKARAKAEQYPVRMVIAVVMEGEKQTQNGPSWGHDLMWNAKIGRKELGEVF